MAPKLDPEEPSLHPISLAELDGFIVALIDTLKMIDDPEAVAEVSNILLTPELTELLMFVGITPKQVGPKIIFAWTEALTNFSKKGSDNEETD